MKCPVCAVDLLMSEKQGIEVDYCPNCRGIWLDRGELDKIIQRSEEPDFPIRKDVHYYPKESTEQGYKGKDHKKKRRFDFLGDILDF